MFTFCMIVKDEAAIIEKCLSAIDSYGYDIVVVDTGSQDNTKEIALKYTDKVYDYKWNDDFSAARNFAIEKTEDEFIIMIDADEIISRFNKEEAEKLIISNADKTGRILILSEFEKNGLVSKSQERVGRVFSKKFYKYEGPIHEQLLNINGSENDSYDLPMVVLHSGYDRSEIKRKDKIKRNLFMLERELEVDSNNPYILHQIGKTYYIAGDYQNAYVYFNKVLNIDLNPELEYVQDLIECYGYTLLNLKSYSEALDLINVYDVFAKSPDFVFLIGVVYMNNGMFSESVSEFMKVTKMKSGKVLGVNSYLAFYNIGVIYECLGQNNEAEKFYLKCSGYEPASNRLKLMNKSC